MALFLMLAEKGMAAKKSSNQFEKKIVRKGNETKDITNLSRIE